MRLPQFDRSSELDRGGRVWRSSPLQALPHLCNTVTIDCGRFGDSLI